MAAGGTRTLVCGDWVRFWTAQLEGPLLVPDGTLARVLLDVVADLVEPVVYLQFNLRDVSPVLRRGGFTVPDAGLIAVWAVNAAIAPAEPTEAELANWAIAELEN